MVLAKSPAGATPIVELHANGGDLFVSARRDTGLQCSGGLFAVSTSSKNATTIKNGCVSSFSVAGDTIAYSARVVIENSYVQARAEVFNRTTKAVVPIYENLAEQSGIAVGGNFLYMSNSSGRFLKRRLDASAALEALAPTSTVPPDFAYGDERFMTADATGVYAFATGSATGQRVFHIHASEDRITQLGADPKEAPQHDPSPLGRFAESERHLYWAAGNNGEVRRVDRRGKCGVEAVAKGRKRPRWVSFANDSVYWLEDDANGQTRIARRKLQ